jgi:hypothetical protein
MAAPYKVQIKGLIRFSYLSEGGYALSSRPEEEIRAILYDPDRLARRFMHFERLALHSVRFQRNEDFKVGVLIGDTFPEDAKAHLKSLVAEVPQMKLVTLPKLPMSNAVRRAFDALGQDPDATHTATFRLDDDDAMHKLTTDRIARLSHALLGIRNAKLPFGIAFNRGFYLDASKRKKIITEWYEKTPLGIGLALVAPRDMQINVFRRNHRKLGEYFDCHTEIGRPMYIRSVHEDNDSSAKPTGRKGELPPEEIKRMLWRGFGLRMDDLKDLNVS